MSTEKMRAVTVADIARAAGVSKATAARVLGGYGNVGEEFRARIERVADALDYRRNDLARTMATGRSATIGVVVGDIENPFFGHVVRGIADRAKTLGFGTLLANTAEQASEERDAVAMLLAKRVDGLIVAPAPGNERAHLVDMLHRGVPLVLVDRVLDDFPADSAVTDNRAAAKDATRLLIDAGHRRIAFLSASRAQGSVGAPASPYETMLSTVRDRISGFLAETERGGLDEADCSVLLGASDEVRTQAVLTASLSPADRPTAIIASDSLLALAVFRAARHAGLAIPRDLSLVTFDDADWMSALSPTVTVFAQPAHALGNEAMAMLAERIDGRTEVRHRILTTTLRARESVSPPRPSPW